ncbi:AAA family ATPase [Paenibacillus filicis]|uniref:AAA family ATPase n=1 Tax=Paenibacillus filicis TaxID=669464 RepID=A0ABU9DIV4_9BACL
MNPHLGFHWIDIVSEDSCMRLYRGILPDDDPANPVLVRVAKSEENMSTGHALLLREFEIAKILQLDKIAKPIALREWGGSLALVLADDGSISLREFLTKSHGLDHDTFVQLARAIASSVKELHSRKLLHLDLRPEHILIHPVTMKLSLTGLGHSLRMATDNPLHLEDLHVSLDRLPYMSPEVACSMQQRQIDERSDLYSLGVLYYEMLTGQWPFKASEPLEWIHAHLAQAPEPLVHHLVQAMDASVVSMVMKLLEKIADDRYAHADALIADLNKMGEQHEPIVMRNTLYGREHEISFLLQAFQSVCCGSTEAVYVSGPAGIGKTSLLEEVFLRRRSWRGTFYITGKFEQISRETPYYPMIQAFRGLLRHLLGASSEQVEAWRSRLGNALKSNEAILGAILPEVKLLIGDFTAAEELPPDEAKKRFFYAFRRFVQVLASKENPLVLFIDDLQWADASSLQLIHSILCDPEIQYFMFVGAYRDTESELNKLPGYEEDGSVTEEVLVHHLSLCALTLAQINPMVTDALNCDAEEALPLTEVLHHRSGGSPFYLKQIFQRLQDDGLVRYSREDRRWHWSLGHILERQPFLTVQELMEHKLLRLSSEAQLLLQIAACTGSEFDAAFIAKVSGREVETVTSLLTSALDEGLIAISGVDGYRFLHDNFQKWIYNRIQHEARQHMHLSIGRELRAGNGEQSEDFFTAVNHYNIGSGVIGDRQEWVQLMEMNLVAGKRAKASTAFDIALVFFRKGTALLDPADWDRHYASCFELHAERAECEYLCGNHEAAEQLVGDLLVHARYPFERARAWMIRITQCINLGEYEEATVLGLQGLKEFQIDISPARSMDAVYAEALEMERQLRPHYKRLAVLPEMTDKNRIAMLQMMFAILASTFFTDKKVFILLAFRAIQLSLDDGNTPVSAAIYSIYGMFLGISLGNYEKGYEVAKIGLELSKRYQVTSIKGITHMLFGGVLCQFVGNAEEGDAYLEKALRYSMESGDYVYSSYSMGAHINSLYTRAPLDVFSKKITEYLDVLAETKDEFVLQNFYLYRQYILALQGETEESCSFNDQDFDEERFLSRINTEETSSTTLFQYHTYKTQLCYLSGRYDEAAQWAQQAEAFAAYATHLPHLPQCLFYESLAILSDPAGLQGENSQLKRVKQTIRQLKIWVKSSPDNFLSKLLLIEAEWARGTKRYAVAEPMYDKAIRHAREQGNIQMESVAQELAAHFYASQGRTKIALYYWQAAYEGYARWGIRVKAQALADRLHSLRGTGPAESLQPDEQAQNGPRAFEATLPPYGIRKETHGGEWMDLVAILKATQAITDQMDLDAVLVEIMSTLMKYAGAQKGAVLMESQGEPYVRIYAAGGEVKTYGTVTPMEDNELLPSGIVRYVYRTKESVVYNTGAEDSWLLHNPYLLKHLPKSALCLPVNVHGASVGVLYLENTLVPGVFSAERIRIFHTMAAQILYICELLRSVGPSDKVREDGRRSSKAPNTMEEPLTEREMEVLALLASGLSNKEIAERLVVAVGTVKVHVKNIFTKLKVNRRTQAIAHAKVLQLLD